MSKVSAREMIREASSCSRVNLVVGFYWPGGESIGEPLFIPINDPAGLGLGPRSDNGGVRIPDPLPENAVSALNEFLDVVLNGRRRIPSPMTQQVKRELSRFLSAVFRGRVWIPEPWPERATDALNDFLDAIVDE